MERAVLARGLSPPSRPLAAAAVRWLPTLTIGAVFERSRGPLSHDQTTVLGHLSWPLDDRRSSDELSRERLHRQASTERQRLLDRIAATWQRRRQAEERNDDLEAELGTQEADAELDVLTGRADEDGP
jgi:hypothetical protein